MPVPGGFDVSTADVTPSSQAAGTAFDSTGPETGTARVKRGMAEMLKGGVIMDVVTPEQAKIAEDAGAVAVMALERVPADIRAQGGIARMSDPDMVDGIINAVSIPVMAKCRIGHFVEAQVLQSLGVDYIDESEVLSPADEAHHVDKWKFTVPFVCGATNLGEALRRIAEGAAMIRSKGEAGTGNVIEATRHMRSLSQGIRRLASLPAEELFTAAKDLQAPYDLVAEVAKAGKLPVVLFTAGGIATPADAAMMMQLGAEGVFVGSGIFKSGDPAKRAAAIVKATTFHDDPDVIAKVSRGLGEAMVGINIDTLPGRAALRVPRLVSSAAGRTGTHATVQLLYSAKPLTLAAIRALTLAPQRYSNHKALTLATARGASAFCESPRGEATEGRSPSVIWGVTGGIIPPGEGTILPVIGVLALQGDVREHVRALDEAGATARPVRRLARSSRSTAWSSPAVSRPRCGSLATAFDLLDPVRKLIADGLPAFGSCAGLIMLADRLRRRRGGPADLRRHRHDRQAQRLRPSGGLLRACGQPAAGRRGQQAARRSTRCSSARPGWIRRARKSPCSARITVGSSPSGRVRFSRPRSIRN